MYTDPAGGSAGAGGSVKSVSAALTIKSAMSNLTSGGSLDALKGDIQDLRAQASSFEDQNDSIANSFWQGFVDGYDD